jgi:hypothetical protein
LRRCRIGQREEIETVWRGELNTPPLIQYRNIPLAPLQRTGRRPIVDVDYLVFNLLRDRFPVNTVRFRDSPIDCYFTVTSVPTGSCCLLRSRDGDFYQLFKAALAVPGCHPEVVSIGPSTSTWTGVPSTR